MMSETERYIPIESDEQKIDAEAREVDAAQHSENSEKKRSLMQKVRALEAKYPKIIKAVVAVELLFLLKLGKEVVEPIVPQAKGVYIEMMATQEEKEKIDALEYKIGALRVHLILALPGPIENGERLMTNEPKIEAEGFENHTITNEEIEGVIQTLPRGFAHNIAKVELANEAPPIKEEVYGSKLAGPTWRTQGFTSASNRVISIVRDTEMGKGYIGNIILTHEAFHLQDWDANKLLSGKEKLELFSKIIERLESPDRFKSNYVESIELSDKQAELERKATEYFAVIGAQYMSPDYKLLPNEDKKLIRDFIKKIDPEFKRGEALKAMDKILGYTPDIDPRSLDERKKIWTKLAEEEWDRAVTKAMKRDTKERPGITKHSYEPQRGPYIKRIITVFEQSYNEAQLSIEKHLKERYEE